MQRTADLVTNSNAVGRANVCCVVRCVAVWASETTIGSLVHFEIKQQCRWQFIRAAKHFGECVDIMTVGCQSTHNSKFSRCTFATRRTCSLVKILFNERAAKPSRQIHFRPVGFLFRVVKGKEKVKWIEDGSRKKRIICILDCFIAFPLKVWKSSKSHLRRKGNYQCWRRRYSALGIPRRERSSCPFSH